MKKASKLMYLIAIAAAIPLVSFAAQATPASKATVTNTEASAPMTDGEVKKVDKDAGKLTIKHGPLTNLGMPGMTMVFRVADAAMLDRVKAGDKVKFNAEKVNGAITVTAIDTSK